MRKVKKQGKRTSAQSTQNTNKRAKIACQICPDWSQTQRPKNKNFSDIYWLF